MFGHLTDFSYKRNSKEALGFYLAYLLFGLIIGGILGGITGALFPGNAVMASLFVGRIAGVVLSVVLGLIVVVAKDSFDELELVAMIVASGIAAYFIGAMGGLIFVAYMTTKPAKGKK